MDSDEDGVVMVEVVESDIFFDDDYGVWTL